MPGTTSPPPCVRAESKPTAPAMRLGCETASLQPFSPPHNEGTGLKAWGLFLLLGIGEVKCEEKRNTVFKQVKKDDNCCLDCPVIMTNGRKQNPDSLSVPLRVFPCNYHDPLGPSSLLPQQRRCPGSSEARGGLRPHCVPWYPSQTAPLAHCLTSPSFV